MVAYFNAFHLDFILFMGRCKNVIKNENKMCIEKEKVKCATDLRPFF